MKLAKRVLSSGHRASTLNNQQTRANLSVIADKLNKISSKNSVSLRSRSPSGTDKLQKSTQTNFNCSCSSFSLNKSPCSSNSQVTLLPALMLSTCVLPPHLTPLSLYPPLLPPVISALLILSHLPFPTPVPSLLPRPAHFLLLIISHLHLPNPVHAASP